MARNSVRVLNDAVMGKLLTHSLPRLIAERYSYLLKHWVKSKGPEWTAIRLKALWNCALLLRSGQSELVPGVCLKARIACVSGIPKGVEGDVVQRWAHIRKPSTLRTMSVALRSYTAIVLPKESTAQVEKSFIDITSPGKEVLVTPHTRLSYKMGLVRRNRYKCLLMFPGGVLTLRRPLQLDKLPRLSGTSSYPSLLAIPSKDRKRTPYLSLASSLLTKGMVPDPLVKYFGDFSMRKIAEDVQLKYLDFTYGKINVIQEGGAKARTICSPNAWVQFYCYPFHKYLMTLVSDLENDSFRKGNRQFGASCCLDQVRGVYLALNRLNNGSFCHAVDLSSATDRFPLRLQQVMCEELGIPEFSQALSWLRGPYWAPDGQQWSYGAGQPMGLYGSFPLFHLTHFSLLNGLSYRLGLSPGDHFCVLGDDVLIFDENLLRLYLDTLEKYEVPISWHKSYKGDLVEFAGFLITKSRNSWTAFRPYKHGAGGEMTSVINVLHALGVNTRKWSSYWERSFSQYQQTLGMRSLDLSPLLPADPDIRKDEGIPGDRWIGSCLNQAAYYDLDGLLPDSLFEAWYEDRYNLCPTEEKWFDPGFTRDAVRDHTQFNPELYIQEDMTRKSIYRQFWRDPLVKSDARVRVL